MPLSTEEIINLSKQGPLSTSQVQNLAITPQALAPQQPLNVATPAPVAPVVPPAPVQPSVTQAPPQDVPSVESIINEQYTPSTEEQANYAQQNATLERIAQLTGQTSASALSARQAQLESTPEFMQKQQQVQDLSSQLNQLVAEQQAIPVQLQQQSVGQGITSSALAGQTEAQLRQNAIKQLGVSSLLSASQGNLTLAINQVNAALKAEFDPLKAELATQQANLDVLKNDPNLTAAEKKRLALGQAKLDARSAQLKQQEADKQGILDMGLKAAQLGADATTLAAIHASTSAAEAQKVLEYSGLLGPGTAKKDTQVVKLDNGQTVIVDTQTGKVISNIGGAKIENVPQGNSAVVINGVETVINDDALAYAQNYASTGKLPTPAELKLSGLSVSDVTKIARGLPKPNGALIDVNTGVKPSTLSADQEKGINALNEIVTKTMPALQDRFGKIATGLVGGTFGTLFTSQDRQDYNTFRAEFLSKLLVARSGAAVTEQEYKRYADLLPSNFNQLFFLGSDGGKKLNSLAKSMQTNLDTTLNTNQLSIVGYSDVKEQLNQLSPEQKAELEKEGLLPAWAK